MLNVYINKLLQWGHAIISTKYSCTHYRIFSTYPTEQKAKIYINGIWHARRISVHFPGDTIRYCICEWCGIGLRGLILTNRFHIIWLLWLGVCMSWAVLTHTHEHTERIDLYDQSCRLSQNTSTLRSAILPKSRRQKDRPENLLENHRQMRDGMRSMV